MLETLLEKLYKKNNIFLTGGAGVGKTTLTKSIIDHYEEHSKKVAKLASTGMAATLIGGQTLHSFFDLGIASSLEDLETRGKITLKKKIAKLIVSMDLIIIDEISMVSASLFEMIRLRLLQASYKGAVMVVGDFLQLPPVERNSFDVAFAFEAPSWERFEFNVINLTEVYRTDDSDFIDILNAVRFGEVQDDEHLYLHHLIKEVPENLVNHTFLFGKNNSAALHNQKQLSNIHSDPFEYSAQITKHKSSVKDEQIERFFSDARVEKMLTLKVGVPVLFTRNSWNYFNGERGLIIKLEKESVHVKKSDGIVVKLERVGISKSSWQEKVVDGAKEMIEVDDFTLFQLPLQLAFGITIHKSQGMSIHNLIIETKEIFAPSQFYVALSRTINPNHLILVQPNVNWANLAYVHPKAIGYVKEYCNS